MDFREKSFDNSKALFRALLILTLIINLIVATLSTKIPEGSGYTVTYNYANLGSGKTHYSIIQPKLQVEEGGGLVSEESVGQEKKVVLVHGLLGDLTHFSTWREILVKNGYTVLTYDLLGHGESEWKVSGFISIEKLVLQLNQLLNELGWVGYGKKVSLLGVSLGGLTVLSYSISYPDDVNKLLMMCPPGLMTREDNPKLYKLSNSIEARLLSNIHKYPRVFRCSVDCLSSFGLFKFEKGLSKKEKKDQINSLHRELSTYVKVGGNNNLFDRFSDYLSLSKLEGKIKMMFFWGIEDDVVPFSPAINYLAQHFNSTKIVVLPFLGHIPQYSINLPLNIGIRFLNDDRVDEIGVPLGVAGDSKYFYDFTVNIIKGINFTYSGEKVLLDVDDKSYPTNFFDIQICDCCFEKYVIRDSSTEGCSGGCGCH